MSEVGIRPEAAGPSAAAFPGTAAGGAPARPPAAAGHRAVAFSGPGSGEGPLSWGQREIWLAMLRQGWLRMGGGIPLPAGATLDGVADELAFMMGRFQSLRTRLRFDAEGRPSQVLSASGEVALEIYDTAEDGDPAAVAAEVEAWYLAKPRDFAEEWPIRMAVVRHRGTLTHLVVITCHLVTDGAGMAVLSRETQARVSGPVEGMQPLELAAWQASPAGRRQSTGAVHHQEKVMRSVVPRRLSASSGPQEPRHWTGELSSPALDAALRVVGARTGADSSAVLMGLYAIAVTRRGIMRPAVIRPLANNRFRPGLANVVCNLVQSGICVFDVADTTVDAVVRQAKRALMASYMKSYFDPDEELALIERIAEEQGPGAERWSPHTWSFFNDRRVSARRGVSEAVTEDGMRELMKATTFRWVEKKENPYEPLFLHIEETPDSVLLIVAADTHYVSPEDNEGLARDIEQLAVEAAFDEQLPTGVKAGDTAEDTAGDAAAR
jgi:hypothetical protein